MQAVNLDSPSLSAGARWQDLGLASRQTGILDCPIGDSVSNPLAWVIAIFPYHCTPSKVGVFRIFVFGHDYMKFYGLPSFVLMVMVVGVTQQSATIRIVGQRVPIIAVVWCYRLKTRFATFDLREHSIEMVDRSVVALQLISLGLALYVRQGESDTGRSDDLQHEPV